MGKGLAHGNASLALLRARFGEEMRPVKLLSTVIGKVLQMVLH